MTVVAVRPPVVAGLFYPADAAELRQQVESLLADADRAATAPPWAPRAVIAPHAGYRYSGPTAGHAFAALRPALATRNRIVILGPAHRVPLAGLGLPAAVALRTPLGEIEIDPDLEAAALELPQVTLAPEAHRPEHSIEVELPFLQVLAATGSAPRVAALVVGAASGEEVAAVIERLWAADDVCVVISSDLSHYLPYEIARHRDRKTANRILELEPSVSHEQACGATPVNGLLLAARRAGLRSHLLDLRSSGDTAGDRSSVVGYGAFAFG